MGSVLGAIGSLGQGYQQGRQSAQALRDQALVISQHQMALDQAKRQLAADAAAFSNLGPQGPGSAPPGQLPPMGAPQGAPQTGQPPMPGQPSVPSQPAGNAMQATPMPGVPQQAPQGGPSAAPGPAPASPAPGSGGDGMGQGGDPYRLIMSVAADIKRRNPSLDGPTLALAVDRIMGLVAPQLRQQTQILTTQMRESGAGDRAQLRADTSTANTGARVGAMERGQDISLQRAQMQVQGAMQRIQVIQQNLNQRFASGQGNKVRLAAQSNRAREIATDLTNATRTLNSLTAALVPAADPRVKAAQDKVNAAQTKLDILDKSLRQGEKSGLDAVKAELAGGPAPNSVAGATDASGPIATDAKGNKVQWNGQTWVPVK